VIGGRLPSLTSLGHFANLMQTYTRSLSHLGLLLTLMALAGCAPPPQTELPLASGQIIKCVLGDKPVMRAGEIGTWTGRDFTQGRIEIYERVVVITDPDGTKHCAPHDWFKEITFK
jgi:hypothetical protein